jgi:hypothetical protein
MREIGAEISSTQVLKIAQVWFLADMAGNKRQEVPHIPFIGLNGVLACSSLVD